MLSPQSHRTKPELVLNSGPQRTSEQPPAAEPLLATIDILTVAISNRIKLAIESRLLTIWKMEATSEGNCFRILLLKAGVTDYCSSFHNYHGVRFSWLICAL